MKYKLGLFIALIILLFNSVSFSQEPQKLRIQLKETPIEKKHSYAVWRTDYYICTGIAYAKSVGKTVKDFAVFVGNKHSLAAPNDTSFASAVGICHFVIMNYPNGHFKILMESDTTVVMQWNRPYSDYFSNGPILGVSIEEFETYLYEHVAIMAKRMKLNFKYNIENDFVTAAFERMK